MFDDPDFRPDELKVYPCSVVPHTELCGMHARGQYAPYTHEQLLDVLSAVLAVTPTELAEVAARLRSAEPVSRLILSGRWPSRELEPAARGAARLGVRVLLAHPARERGPSVGS